MLTSKQLVPDPHLLLGFYQNQLQTAHLAIYHRLADRVRAHAFLCMLAYYVRWHMEQALTPLKNREPEIYHSFAHVLYRLQQLQLNTVETEGVTFDLVTEPDTQQRLFLEHLEVKSLLPKTRRLQKQ